MAPFLCFFSCGVETKLRPLAKRLVWSYVSRLFAISLFPDARDEKEKKKRSERKERGGGGREASDACQKNNSLPFCAGVQFSRDSPRARK